MWFLVACVDLNVFHFLLYLDVALAVTWCQKLVLVVVVVVQGSDWLCSLSVHPGSLVTVFLDT